MNARKGKPLDEVLMFLGKRLEQAMAEIGMSREELGEQTGYEAGTVYAWLKGSTAPNLATLMLIAEIFKKTVDWFLPPQAYAPAEVIIDASDYENQRTKLIQSIQQELWIVNRVGTYFSDSKDTHKALRAVMKERDIRLHIMLPDPKKREAVTTVALARDSASADTIAAKAQIQAAIRSFTTIIKQSHAPSLSELLLIPYAPVWVSYIADPHTPSAKALVATVVFRDQAPVTPFMLVEKSKTSTLFNWFYEDTKRMWTTFGGSKNT